MKKLFLLTFAFIFSCNFIFGQTTYKTVYKCDFEDGENLTNWHLQTRSFYQSNCNSNPNATFPYDYFHIGTATSYNGNKSLYVSEDEGQTNTYIVPIME